MPPTTPLGPLPFGHVAGAPNLDSFPYCGFAAWHAVIASRPGKGRATWIGSCQVTQPDTHGPRRTALPVRLRAEVMLS